MRILLRKHRASLFAVALLILLAAVCAVRSLYGFDWSDETYYVALPYRFLLGDAPFANSWDLHQLAAFFTVPLMRLYLLCSGGSTEGVLLFFRLSYVVFTFLTSVFAFFTLKKRFPFPVALTVSALLLTFVHFAIGNFSYDTQVILFAAWSILLLIRADAASSGLLTLLAGLFYAFAVQSYPQFAFSVPVWALFFWFRRRDSKRADSRDRSWLWFCSGIAAAVALFLLFLVLYGATPGDLVRNLSHLFDEPAHQYAESPVRLFLNYGHTLLVVFGPVAWLTAALTAAALAVRWIKREPLRARLRAILPPCVLACGLLGILRILTYGRVESAAVMNFLAMPLAILYPALFLLEDPKSRTPYAPLLFGLGLTLSLAVHLFSSNMLIRASSFPLILCTFASLLSLPSLAVSAPSKPRLMRALSLLICAAITASVAFYRVAAVYRDEPIPALDTAIAAGPLAGIRTTAEEADVYASILSDVQKYAPDTGAILFSYIFPFGYLMTDLRPAAPSVWSANFNTDTRLSAYYGLFPELAPSCIVVLPEGVGIVPDKQDAQRILELLPDGDSFRKIDCDHCTIYLKS